MKILLPFDGSPAALHAAELLAGYAGDVANLAPLALNVQAHSPDPGRTVLKPALERLAAAGIAVQPQVQVGPVAPTILSQARWRQSSSQWSTRTVTSARRSMSRIRASVRGSWDFGFSSIAV